MLSCNPSASREKILLSIGTPFIHHFKTKIIMKKLTVLLFTTMAFASCNNGATETKETMKDSTVLAPAAVAMNYPYTIDHPDNWEMGSTDNTMAALSGLKAYENGNVAECAKYFGDSVRLQFDGFDTKVSNDTLKAMFTKTRASIKSMEIKMDDWESVISKDKTAEYVSLWYKEIWEDNKGKKDSLEHMDDIRMKNGKIISLNEKSRKLPAKAM